MITSYELRNGMIRVQVQGSSREFVYPEHKFKDKEALLREITRSRANETKRTADRVNRRKRVTDALDADIGGRR